MSERSARGFVLDRRVFREHDLRAELLLDDGDRVEVLAPSGQRSRQRFAGGLMPLALYRFGMTPSAKGLRLDEARVERAWPSLLADLTRQTAVLAGSAAVREVGAPGDGTFFLLLGELHENVAADVDAATAPARLLRFVVEVLEHAGHAPVLDRCVRCGAPAPDAALTTLDPAAGGVVCRACGGGPYRLLAADRAALRAVIAGELGRYTPGLTRVLGRVLSSLAPDAAVALERAEAMFSRAR